MSAAEEARWAEWQALHDGLVQSIRADVHELMDQMRDVKLTVGGIEASLKELEMAMQELKQDIKMGKTILASRHPLVTERNTDDTFQSLRLDIWCNQNELRAQASLIQMQAYEMVRMKQEILELQEMARTAWICEPAGCTKQ
jgi:hypothetical protein